MFYLTHQVSESGHVFQLLEKVEHRVTLYNRCGGVVQNRAALARLSGMGESGVDTGALVRWEFYRNFICV